MKVKKINLINILIIPRTVLNSESNHAKILVRNTSFRTRVDASKLM